jgi:hypothetical protein
MLAGSDSRAVRRARRNEGKVLIGVELASGAIMASGESGTAVDRVAERGTAAPEELDDVDAPFVRPVLSSEPIRFGDGLLDKEKTEEAGVETKESDEEEVEEEERIDKGREGRWTESDAKERENGSEEGSRYE